MLYLNYLFLIFEWSACKLAGQAKCSFHYKQAFNLFFFVLGLKQAQEPKPKPKQLKKIMKEVKYKPEAVNVYL